MNAIAQPLGILLKLIFDLIGNYGVSIIVFTVIVKLIMLPLTIKQMNSMKKMQEIQPKIKELQEKYKNDKEKLNVKTMELYSESKVSPFGGCLPLIIQIPIIIGLFTVLRNPGLYVFESQEVYEAIDTSFLWMENLKDPDLWILPILAGLATYLSSVTMSTGNNDQSQKMMSYIFPVLMVIWGRGFPAGVTLYWVVSNFIQWFQQLLIKKPYGKLKEGSN